MYLPRPSPIYFSRSPLSITSSSPSTFIPPLTCPFGPSTCILGFSFLLLPLYSLLSTFSPTSSPGFPSPSPPLLPFSCLPAPSARFSPFPSQVLCSPTPYIYRSPLALAPYLSTFVFTFSPFTFPPYLSPTRPLQTGLNAGVRGLTRCSSSPPAKGRLRVRLDQAFGHPRAASGGDAQASAGPWRPNLTVPTLNGGQKRAPGPTTSTKGALFGA